MSEKMLNTKRLSILDDAHLESIRGGWHPFPHGLFGRDGKPFFGRDLVRIVVPAAVKIGVSMIPGGAPFATAAATATFKVMEKN